MRDVTIRITNEDYRKGQRRSTEACAVARAARRAIPGITEIFVRHSLVIWRGKDRERFVLPDRIKDVLESWDAGNTPSPQEFTVRIA